MLKKFIDKKCLKNNKCKLVDDKLNKIKHNVGKNSKPRLSLGHKIYEHIGHINSNQLDSKKEKLLIDKIDNYLSQFTN